MFAALDCILYFAVPAKPYHVCPASILAKLYSNALLVVLNGRARGSGAMSGGAPRDAQRRRDTFVMGGEGEHTADVLPLEVRGADDFEANAPKYLKGAGLV